MGDLPATRSLEAGAQPNASHSYPTRGRTPLMLAAENDLPELFNLMCCRHGGDPLQPDAEGHSCWDIARSFGAWEVMGYLQRMVS
ncbi:ankyrin repeat domain-containing protein [Acidovorax sp. SUPP3334]|uniref:ankyrin repeat domain-containing protein n=1 Tax=Acidovorax sp. SUPP3334 TaxID=2920881 RepID=UPI0032EA7B00